MADMIVPHGGPTFLPDPTDPGGKSPDAQIMSVGFRPPDRGRSMSVVFSRRDETDKDVLIDRFCFQMPPTETFHWTAGYTHSDFDTVSAGQYSRKSGRQLMTLSFSTLFVDYDPPFAAWHYGTRRGLEPVDPLGWNEQLLELLNTGTPFNVTAGMPAWNGEYDIKALAVTLRQLDVEERAGEPDARYDDIQLVEWRPLSLARKRRGLPVTLTVEQKSATKLKATWNVGAGDQSMTDPTLAQLAKHFYGSASRWRVIARYKKNKGLSGVSVRDDLSKYVAKHGTGKKDHRKLKIVIPELPDSDPRSTEGSDQTMVIGG